MNNDYFRHTAVEQLMPVEPRNAAEDATHFNGPVLEKRIKSIHASCKAIPDNALARLLDMHVMFLNSLVSYQ